LFYEWDTFDILNKQKTVVRIRIKTIVTTDYLWNCHKNKNEDYCYGRLFMDLP